MFTVGIFTVFLILVTLFIYRCYIIPKKVMKFYENQLKNSKYTAKIQPYKILVNNI